MEQSLTSNDMTKQQIGQAIRARRKEQGWTIDALAHEVGIRKATLIDVELGRNHKIDTLNAILEHLDGEMLIIWG